MADETPDSGVADEDREATGSGNEIDESPHLTYLPDETIDDIENDAFGHDAYVDIFENIIHSNEPPWHIGLFGTWGSGKSSIINLLFERIRSSREAHTPAVDHGDSGFSISQWIPNTSTPEESQQSESAAAETTVDESADEESSEENDLVDEIEEAENIDDTEELDYRFDFSKTACVKVDAWQHDVDSIRTGILLDLNRAIAEEVMSESGGDSDNDSCELLGSDELLNTLHDIEETTDQDFWNWFWGNIRSLLWKLVFFLGILGAIGLLLLSIAVGTNWSPSLPGSLDPTTGLASLILVVILTTVLKQVFQTKSATSRTLVNPRRNWAGSYADLFDEILDQAKQEYEETHGEKLDKLVIAIDDLDRCDSQTVYETLIALKSFLESDDCIFIIPCDEDALYRHIQAADDGTYLDEQTNQRDFLAKFFETQIRITKPSDQQIESFAIDKINELDIGLSNAVARDVLLEANLRTPRRVIQAINRTATMYALAQNRDVSAIQVSNPEHVKFLAKIAVLQEDYPEFHEALVDGRLSLRDLIDPAGEQETTIPELTADLETLDISREQRRRLAEFLIATRTVYQPPDPYLRLLGEEIDFIEQFERALDHGRIQELRRRISMTLVEDEDDEVEGAQQELLELVLQRLEDADNTAEYFRTTLAISDAFAPEYREELAQEIFTVLDAHDGRRIELLDDLVFDDLEFLADPSEPGRMVSLLEWYIDATITDSEFDEANLDSLYEFVNSMDNQLRGIELESIRQKFAENVHAARDEGTISRSQYQQIVNNVSRDYHPLYSEALVGWVA